MATKREPRAGELLLKNVRLSYANIWKPRASDDSDKEKYSASLLIPKKDKAQIKAVLAAIEEAKEAGKKKWGGKIPKILKSALHDGDEEREDEAYEGMMYVSAKSDTQPGIVDRNVNDILDQSEVYSGCFCNVHVNFYAYAHPKGGNGIACGLNHIQKVKDGEPLSGSGRAQDVFESVDDVDDVDGGDDPIW
jgi:hypothetical protein